VRAAQPVTPRIYPGCPCVGPTTKGHLVTWRVMSPKSACKIRQNPRSLCSATPVVKRAFHGNRRQIRRFRERCDLVDQQRGACQSA